MNAILQQFARDWLRDNIRKLPNDWQETFKLMYARDGGKRSVENSKLMEIDVIIDTMPDGKLDWAMMQILNSLKKLERYDR